MQAEEIGREGSNYMQDKLQMQHVYDYMFHLLSEYGKLMRYKPTVPPGAVELCSEFMVCPRADLEQAYKVETAVVGPATNDPCTLMPPFVETEVDAMKEEAPHTYIHDSTRFNQKLFTTPPVKLWLA